MDSRIYKSRVLFLFFAAVLMLCACAKNKQPIASPTPYAMPYTAQPTGLLMPQQQEPCAPSLEQMKAQAEKGVPWYVRVDACNQLVSVYARDGDRKYTLLAGRFVCSTPQGLGPVLLKTGGDCPLVKTKMKPDESATGYRSEYAIDAGSLLSFRSVPVMDADPSRLDGALYNSLTFGTDKPYIVLTPADAAWLYDNISEGALIEIVYDSPDPDLVQSLMPMPYVNGCALPGKEEFRVYATCEPQIVWGNLYEAPAPIGGRP